MEVATLPGECVNLSKTMTSAMQRTILWGIIGAALWLMGACGSKFERTLQGTWSLQSVERNLYVNGTFSDVKRPTATGTITFDKKNEGSFDISIDHKTEKVTGFIWTASTEGDQTVLTIDPGRWTHTFGTPPKECTVKRWTSSELEWEMVDTVYYRNNALYKWVEVWTLTK